MRKRPALLHGAALPIVLFCGLAACLQWPTPLTADETVAPAEFLQQRIGGKDAAVKMPSVRGVAISADGNRIAAFGEFGVPVPARQVQVWNTNTGELLHTVGDHEEPIRDVVLAPNGSWLISTSFTESEQAGSTTMWNLKENTRGWTVPQSGELLTLSPDATTVSLMLPNQIRVLRTDNGEEVQRFLAPTKSLALSADGKQVLTVVRKTDLRLVDIINNAEILTFTGCERTPRTAAIAPDGHTVAAADGAEIMLWEARSGRMVHRLSGHGRGVMRLAFSPDSRHVFAGDTQGKLHVWEIASGEDVLVTNAHTGYITAMAWRADSSQILTGGTDRSLALWSTIAMQRTAFKTPPASPAEQDDLWQRLGSSDAGLAYRSVGTVFRFPDVMLPEMTRRVEQITLPAQKKRILELVKQLEDRSYAIRFRASRELLKIRSVAEATLVAIHNDSDSPALREQITQILSRGNSGPRFTDEDVRRMQRLAYALQQTGTRAAETLLEMMARDFPEAAVIAAATDALQTIRKSRRN